MLHTLANFVELDVMKEPNVSRPVCSEIGNHHPIVEVTTFKT